MTGVRWYACPDGFVFAKRGVPASAGPGYYSDAVEVSADGARRLLRERCTRETDAAIAAYHGRMERLGLTTETGGGAR